MLFCFRLLTEYHSFLFSIIIKVKDVFTTSFRLLTEYHSFLLNHYPLYHYKSILLFPSPYGVSFILITQALE